MSQDSAPSAVTVWHRHLASSWMLATGLLSALGLIAVAAVDHPHWAITLWLLIISAAFLSTGAIRVTVSPDGVTAGSALIPLLRRRFPLKRIEHASARWTRPTEIGGLGLPLEPGPELHGTT